MSNSPTHEDHVSGALAVVDHVVAFLLERDRHEPATAGVNAAKRVRRWLDGEKVSIEQLSRSAKAASNRGHRYQGSRDDERRAWAFACFAAGNLAVMACKESGWKELDDTIVGFAASAFRVVGEGDRRKQLQKVRTKARAASRTARKGRAKKVERDVAPRGEPFSGARQLDPRVRAWLRELGARVDPRFVSDRASLAEALRARGVRSSKALRQFEARYGGLEIGPGGEDQEPEYFFGVLRCGELRSPKKSLVPVGFAGDAAYLYIDPRGVIWAEDMEYPPEVFAPSGDVAISRIALNTILFQHRVEGRCLELEGRHGERIARELSLRAVRNLGDDDLRVWADARRIVAQYPDLTLCAGPSVERVRTLV